MAANDPVRRRPAATRAPAVFGVTLGAALAALIIAGSFTLPETQAPVLRRALVDLPAGVLALAGAPRREWLAIMGETL